MKYKIYHKGSRVMSYQKDDRCILFAPVEGEDVDLAEYIRNMPEPTVEVDGNIVSFTFEPVPQKVAEKLVESKKLRFQVVRHKACSAHSSGLNPYFQYSWEFPKYKEYQKKKPGQQKSEQIEINEYHSISIPNNGNDGKKLNIVSTPTVEELTEGYLERNVKNFFDYIILKKCKAHGKGRNNQWTAEFYFGFIYWEDLAGTPRIFKMDYYSRDL